MILLFVCPSIVADGLAGVDCILNCDSTSRLPSGLSENSYFELPIVVCHIFFNPCCFLNIIILNLYTSILAGFQG
jgi:hypothetical protein